MRKIIICTSILLMVVIKALSQNVGIGTNAPLAKLEVKGVGSNSLTNNLILRNSNGDTLLRMRDDGRIAIGYNGTNNGRTLNIGGNGLNLYRSNTIFAGAIFPTDTSIVMWSEFSDNNYVILQPQWGKVGIGTYSPKAKLHVKNGSSGGIPDIEAVAVFESSQDAAINLMTPNAKASAIYFGNVTNPHHGSITYNSDIAFNGLSFRCNGTTRAVLDDIGNFGIGKLTPDARLHVSNGTGGGLYHSESELIIEDNNPAYIQFSTPTDEASGFLAGNTVTSIRSALLFLADSSVQIRSGGNSTKLIVDNNGNTAIGNFTPSFRLHLNTDSAAKTTSSTWTVPSDARLKKDVHEYDGGLDEIVKIQPVWFTYTGEAGMPNETGVGVIAQELQQVAPYMVGTWSYKDERGNVSPYLSVNNGAMTYMLINAVKEQQNIITSLQTKLESLEKEMKELKSLVLKM